jgi:hypothetical protein
MTKSKKLATKTVDTTKTVKPLETPQAKTQKPVAILKPWTARWNSQIEEANALGIEAKIRKSKFFNSLAEAEKRVGWLESAIAAAKKAKVAPLAVAKAKKVVVEANPAKTAKRARKSSPAAAVAA